MRNDLPLPYKSITGKRENECQFECIYHCLDADNFRFFVLHVPHGSRHHSAGRRAGISTTWRQKHNVNIIVHLYISIDTFLLQFTSSSSALSIMRGWLHWLSNVFHPHMLFLNSPFHTAVQSTNIDVHKLLSPSKVNENVCTLCHHD